MDPFRLDGQVALITGGGSGLGLAMARCLAAAGARVAIVGRRKAVLVEAAAGIGPAAAYFVHDVTRLSENAGLIARVEAAVGPVSILINNAGIHLKKPALDTTEQEFQNVLNAHVLAGFSLSRAAARGMVERRGGSILFITSMTAIMGVPLVVAYSAAKTAYLGMVRSLAAELSPRGVRVNAIAPGWIDTPMLREALANDPARSAKVLSRTPMGRFGVPDDIGWAAVYLCSPAANFITGQVLAIDGGASIGF
ncbi:MAG: glucose 1-dehydrogenase [Planctomycetes bacterium]|nr:glucose 1-dehydrogenase [Planctomycetota bacterium]